MSAHEFEGGAVSRRVAVVTGAGGGLGRACVTQLAADGFAVAALDVSVAALDGFDDDVLSVAADVTTRDGCASAVADVVGTLGRVDALVNSAGVYPRRPVLDISTDDWQHVFEVNVLGTYFMMIEAIADMRTRGAGQIVNVSSIDGFTAHPANAHYAATKAAVISLTRSLALEVAPLGIRVNSVAPGPMATETAKATEWYAPMVAELPTRAPIEPAEIAEVVSFLCRPGNISIAGENIIVSGGGVIA